MPMPSYPDPRPPAGTRSRRSGGSRRRPSASSPSPGQWLADHALLVCLFGILLLALLAEMQWLTRPVRAHLLQAAVVLVYTLIAAAGPASGRLTLAALRGPSLWLLALLAWCALSAVRAPYPTFAVAEMLRLALGAGVYVTAAYVLRPYETRLLPYLLLGLGVATGLYGLIQFGAEGNFGTSVIESIFATHEQFGSFLVLLLPLGLALALDRDQEPKKLLFAQGAALLIGAALLLARTRSAWIGATVSLPVLILLTLRYSSIRLNRTNRALIIGPALIITLAFASLMTFGELAPLVTQRAATLTHAGDDGSFQDRLLRWKGACRMTSERPVTGWGLGAWPVMQGRWTHYGDDTSEVLTFGTGHPNIAHNFWVQWAAETGGIGLALHIGLIIAFLLAGLRAVPTLDQERRTLLIGCLTAIIAGIADMVGAPSYTYPGVSSLFWVLLGIGIAILREMDEVLPVRQTDWAVPLGVGLAAGLVIVAIGYKLREDGQTIPRGTLTVTAHPAGPVAPGTRVLWTATYRDSTGKPQPTAPGVVWTTIIGHLENPSARYIDVDKHSALSSWLDKSSAMYIIVDKGPKLSAWEGNVSGDMTQVVVQASYWDNFSRRYNASQTVSVKSDKNHVGVSQ